MRKSSSLSLSNTWFYVVISGNIFLLLVLFLRADGVLAQSWALIYGLSGRFTLATENNIAVWWSGFLFLLLSVHAFDEYVLHRRKKPVVARGWAAFFLLMLIFSADEIGSFHERADQFLHLGTWLSLLPFGLIVMALFITTLISLGSDPEHRRKLRPLLLAFFLFGTVVIQEYLEHKVNWEQWSPLRVVVEEGTELLGISILLKAFMTDSFGFLNRRQIGEAPVFDIILALRFPIILLLGLLFAPLLGYATASLSDQFRGHPADWFASTIFVFAALAVARPILKDRARLDFARGNLIAINVAASIVAVAASESWDVNLSFLPAMSIKMILLGVLALMAASIWPLSRNYPVRVYVPAVFLLVGLILFSIFQMSLFMVFTLPIYIGFVAFFVNTSEIRGYRRCGSPGTYEREIPATADSRELRPE